MASAPDGGGAAALGALERRVRDAVRGAPGAAFASPLPHLSPEEQVEVYRAQWFARLRDVLRSDYPGVAAVLGGDGFADLVHRYLAAHPPRHWDISRAGERLAGFVAEEEEDLPHREFLADLARLEWAVTAAFDAPDAPVLHPGDLAGMDPGRLTEARFPRAATARVLVLGHPVNGFLDAVRRAGEPAVPGPGEEAVLVFRAGTRVNRMVLTAPMRAALEALWEGAPLGEAMARCAAAAGEEVEALAPRVTAWFGEWASGGVFGPVAGPVPLPGAP